MKAKRHQILAPMQRREWPPGARQARAPAQATGGGEAAAAEPGAGAGRRPEAPAGRGVRGDEAKAEKEAARVGRELDGVDGRGDRVGQNMLESYGEGAGSPAGYVHYTKGGKPGYYPPIKGRVGGQIQFNLYDPFNWFPEQGAESKARGLKSCLLYTSPSPRDVEESSVP